MAPCPGSRVWLWLFPSRGLALSGPALECVERQYLLHAVRMPSVLNFAEKTALKRAEVKKLIFAVKQRVTPQTPGQKHASNI